MVDKKNNKRIVEEAIAARAAQTDKQGWKSFMSAFGEKQQPKSAEDFEQLVKSGRLK